MAIDYSKIVNTELSRNDAAYMDQNLDNMLTVMGDFRLTPRERQAANGITHANKGFVADVIAGVQIYQDMLPGYIKITTLEQAWRFFQQLERLKVKANRLNELIRDLRLATGDLLYRDARSVYRTLQAADQHEISGLEALMDKLVDRYARISRPQVEEPEAEEAIVIGMNSVSPVVTNQASQDGPMAA